ncbi:hypothetical protein JCM10908_003404 [Rhodotorula pacifica]|uniref:uncharacterized protein n=1 Tax=Rhodotorula pacifica TaxID=1495444 RepID=UPI00316BA4F1
MLADSDLSDEEEQAPYAYWETKSILELHGAPPPPRSDGAAGLAPPPPARRSSQRSGAPSPSLAVTANGTPKIKRTTTNASLPSPSGSGNLLAAPEDAKALRQKKRRKAAAGKRRAAAAQPEPSGEPFDAKTLEVLSQLAKKMQARAAGNGSPALGRTRAASVAAGSMSKAAQPVKEATGSPVRQATTTNLPAAVTTPLRRTPARTARQQPVQTLLNLSATKAGQARNSPRGSIRKQTPAPVAVSSPVRGAVPPPAAIAQARDVPQPEAPYVGMKKKAEEKEEDNYFDDEDDFAFEAALSQLDVDSLQPTPPPPPPALAPALALATSPATTLQLTETLRADSYDHKPSTTKRAAPILQKAQSMPAAAGSTRSTTASVPPPRSNVCRTTSAPPPLPRVVKLPPAVVSKPPPPPPCSKTARPGGPTPLSAVERSALEELARKEVAALADLDGVDLWDDEDDEPF